MSPLAPPSPTFGAPPPGPPQLGQEQPDAQWMDQLNQNMLLAVQAFQRLHAALDQKFTR